MREKLTYANVVSTLCLFILLGGGAYASQHLKKNSVGSAQLKSHSVTNPKLKNGAVSSSKLSAGVLGNTALAGTGGTTLLQYCDPHNDDPGTACTSVPLHLTAASRVFATGYETYTGTSGAGRCFFKVGTSVFGGVDIGDAQPGDPPRTFFGLSNPLPKGNYDVVLQCEQTMTDAQFNVSMGAFTIGAV